MKACTIAVQSVSIVILRPRAGGNSVSLRTSSVTGLKMFHVGSLLPGSKSEIARSCKSRDENSCGPHCRSQCHTK
jgi:hypothetical protein